MLSWLSSSIEQISAQASQALDARRAVLRFESHRGTVAVHESADLLAEGGFGFIYRVIDVETNQAFAMKKMICQEERSLKQALREADVLDSLPKHQNVVGYYGRVERPIASSGSYSAGKEVLMLLELCPGGTLLDFMEKHQGKVPERDLMKAFQDVVEAVFLLHSLHPPVAHRDLKCENVLLGSDGCWKLVDFGSWTDEKVDLANANRATLMRVSEDAELNVTMMYRPPELSDVYQRKMIGVAVDMWQLGCILYTLMFYRHPFQDAESLAIPQANYSLPPHQYDDKLEDVMHWLLAQDPVHRLTSRTLVTYLWQWSDVASLPLPRVVEEKKQKLRAKAAALRGPVPIGPPYGLLASTTSSATARPPSPQPVAPPVQDRSLFRSAAPPMQCKSTPNSSETARFAQAALCLPQSAALTDDAVLSKSGPPLPSQNTVREMAEGRAAVAQRGRSTSTELSVDLLDLGPQPQPSEPPPVTAAPTGNGSWVARWD